MSDEKHTHIYRFAYRFTDTLGTGTIARTVIVSICERCGHAVEAYPVRTGS